MQGDPSRNTFPLSLNAPSFTHEGKTYQFISTEDGSPSIRMWSDAKDGSASMRPEAMHHCAGALSESLYIYGALLDEVISRGWPPHVLSVGLGCAYNEWIALATHFRHSESQFYLESFEADSLLLETFEKWLVESPASSPANTNVADRICQLFDDVVDHVAVHFQLDNTDLKNLGRQSFQNRRWQIRGQLDNSVQFEKKFNAIFFDAFSTKATPELWGDEFLDWLLGMAADSNCAFSTYAATGRLNRALKRANFTLVPLPGFSGKRESTRAFRRKAFVQDTVTC